MKEVFNFNIDNEILMGDCENCLFHNPLNFVSYSFDYNGKINTEMNFLCKKCIKKLKKKLKIK